MGSIQGKMTVDLYANPDPFVQGMKAAENAAKKSGGGIAASIEKINAKQMKNVMGNVLKTVGIVGAIETGQQIMLATIKGMSDGSVKGLADFGKVAASAVTSVVKGLPVLGTFMEIGEEIGKMVTGVNDLVTATANSTAEFEGMKKVLGGVNESRASASSQIDDAYLKTHQVGMSSGNVSIENSVIKKRAADKLTVDAFAEERRKYDRENTGKTPGIDGIQLRQRSTEAILKLEERLNKETEIMKKILTEQNNLAEEKQNKIDIYNQSVKDQDALEKQILDTQKSTAEWVEQQHQRYLDLGRTKRMIYELELQSHKGMTDAGKKQLMQEFDALEAVKKTADAKQEAAQQAADDLKATATLETDIATAKKHVNDLSKNNMATVDSAIGSIKVAGSQDFSKSQEMALAQKTLTNAIELKRYMESMDKTLKTMGGIT